MRIECLDGLRGIAALWVLIGHCMILTGFYLPVIGQPDLGVDLFIFLSGFLMVFQFQLRQEREDWARISTWVTFWTRRFFRLSPLYFFLLVIALLAGKQIYADRVLIDMFLDNPLQQAERYTDATALNFLLHFSYLFGLIPSYSFRTPLPDWSLALEMQFYAVFPLIVVLARKTGWIIAAASVAIVSVLIGFLTGEAGVTFPMPSFLALKMHMFLAGMLIAAATGQGKLPYLFLAAVLAAIPLGGRQDILHFAARELMMLGLFSLVHWRNMKFFDQVSGLLGSPPFHWLGDLSYGVYLIHLLVLHAVAAWSIELWGSAISNVERFAIVLAIVMPAVYGLAYVTYRLVERPGQTLGRNLLIAVGRRRQAAQSIAEKIAAP